MRKSGFMLLETLLALALGSGVLFGMMEIFQRTHRTSEKMEAILRLNRDACLIFNQIERDITTALIGPFEEKLTDSEKKPEEKKIEKPEKNKDDEQKTEFFYAAFYSDLVKKKEEYTMKMLQKMSLINTNPFLIYEEPKIRLVRVVYEINETKKIKRDERQKYTLLRKETYDLKNNMAKIDPKAKESPTIYTEIRTHCLNKNIISFFAYFHFYQEDEEAKKSSDKNGQKSKTVMLPYLVDIEMTIEDGQNGYQQSYNGSFPILSPLERPAEQTGTTAAPAEKTDPTNPKQATNNQKANPLNMKLQRPHDMIRRK